MPDDTKPETRRIYTWEDLLVIGFCCFILGIAVGYGWHMYHESLRKPMPKLNVLYIPDLAREIDKREDFSLHVDSETDLHFIPIRMGTYTMAVRREKRPSGN